MKFGLYSDFGFDVLGYVSVNNNQKAKTSSLNLTRFGRKVQK